MSFETLRTVNRGRKEGKFLPSREDALNRDTAVLMIFFGVICCIFSWTNNPESDTYFLAYTGKYILNNGFPKMNPSCAGEGGIVIQQWVMCIIHYFLFEVFGVITGTCLWGSLALAAGTGMLYKYTSLFTNKAWSRLTATIVGFFCINIIIATSRPSSVTFLLLVEYLILLNTQRKKAWLFIPVFSFIFTNVHATFWPFLYVLALPYLFPSEIADRIIGRTGERFPWRQWISKELLLDYVRENKGILTGLFLGLGTGLMNPYGVKGMLYLFLSYGVATSIGITELKATIFLSICGLVILVCFGILVLYVSKNYYRKDCEDFWCKTCMLAGTIILACMHVRNLWFLAFGVVPVLCSLLHDHINEENSSKTKLQKYVQNQYHGIARALAENSRKMFFISLATILVYTALMKTSGTELTEIKDGPLTPIEAANYLDKTEGVGNTKVLSTFNDGTYLEWRGYTIFIDNRPEIYGEKIFGYDMFGEYLDAMENGDLSKIITKYDFEYILVPEDSVFEIWASFIKEDDLLEIVVEGEGYTLWHVTNMEAFSDRSVRISSKTS